MQVSLDISMYPLDRDYEPPILDFIARLQVHEQLTVRPNVLSTQVFGDYDVLMDILTHEIRTSFAQGLPTVMTLKLVNLDRANETV